VVPEADDADSDPDVADADEPSDVASTSSLLAEVSSGKVPSFGIGVRPFRGDVGDVAEAAVVIVTGLRPFLGLLLLPVELGLACVLLLPLPVPGVTGAERAGTIKVIPVDDDDSLEDSSSSESSRVLSLIRARVSST
jgi:hypothetical protein